MDVMLKKETPGNEAGLMRTAKAVQALVAQAPGAVQRDRMVQHAAERLGISPVALRRDLARKKERPAPAAEPEAPVAPPVKHPEEEVSLVQLLLLHPEEVLPVVADHLPPEHLSDLDCRLLLTLILDDPATMMDRIPEDRPEAQRLAARIQVEDTKPHDAGISPAKAAQQRVIALWRKVLKQRRTQLPSGKETAVITLQLGQLDKGWEHSVDFLVV
jgi:DNA primase